jgi:hypothetical protein
VGCGKVKPKVTAVKNSNPKYLNGFNKKRDGRVGAQHGDQLRTLVNNDELEMRAVS